MVYRFRVEFTTGQFCWDADEHGQTRTNTDFLCPSLIRECQDSNSSVLTGDTRLLSQLSVVIRVCPCPFRLLFEEVSGTELWKGEQGSHQRSWGSLSRSQVYLLTLPRD